MTGTPSPAEVAAFARDGFLAPVEVMGEAEAGALLARLEEAETRFGADLPLDQFRRTNAHLVFTVVDRIVHDGRVLDAIESLLGPDLLLWDSDLIVKEPGSPGYVSWHQDLRYMGIEPLESLTAWLALTSATGEMGCMRFLPGSRRHGLLDHVDTHAAANMLTRGQTVSDGIDEARAVAGSLRPGQMSIHNGLTLHASEPNRSRRRRIGLAMRFLKPGARQTKAADDYALLVRGKDLFGHFHTVPRPQSDFAPEAVAAWRRISDEQCAYYFDGGEATWTGGAGAAGS